MNLLATFGGRLFSVAPAANRSDMLRFSLLSLLIGCATTAATVPAPVALALDDRAAARAGAMAVGAAGTQLAVSAIDGPPGETLIVRCDVP